MYSLGSRRWAPTINGVYNPYTNGRKYVGNWGDNPTYRVSVTPIVTGWARLVVLFSHFVLRNPG